MTDTVIRGYARTPEQAKSLKDSGLTDRVIYLEGHGAETLDTCLDSFRDRPGVLVIAGDLRVFGPTKRAISAFMDRIEQCSIRIRDLANPSDLTHAAMIQRANVAISSSRLRGDRPRARRQGRMGGIGKGRSAEDARNGIAPRWLIDRVVDHRSIPWPVKLDLLGPHFTESTLRRHYGADATARKH